ncbi:uncharacterized protein PV09_07761 [Verruconis gallopava]|uniref:Uncharacterized protein n=1 Tax=Verruconis gallopava TaxID=253628 RepID=A0A0D1XEZ5_9PEZI|nr:uncharacterized protein PV09_07761 [Verruconis gallopava]KIW00781.1 hypothetical protein PV09_07761 [Verruconis gallopava]
MAEQHPRRIPNITPSVAAPPVIPPPPPLPEPKRSAFTRFVTQSFTTYGSRPATAQPGREGGRAAAFPQLPGYSPLTSQYAKFKAKVTAEIAALDINQDRTHAILAGREILETVRVNGTTCSEDLNIREALYSHDRHNATRHRDNLDIHDVKWSHGPYSNFIACAATNGKVVIYDLVRPGIEVSRLHEHHRQVHRVAFSPHHGALLLSASHDGSVRFWDLRDMRPEVASITARAKYSGQSDAVRDVRWSPSDGLEFALGTDSGAVQRWDYRSPKAAKLKINNAHDGGCTSVDWHPDGKHLLSAGQDRMSGNRSYGMLKIWDFSSDHKRQKPAWTLRTPYTVTNARWRPPCWSGDEHGRGSWQATQVVTSYDEKHPVIHLWDFRRPYIPFREVYTSRTAPTDMLWHSIDLLWSVGREGEFYQTDVKYAPKTIDRRPLSTFAISPTGEMVAFGQKRTRRRRSDMELSLPDAPNPAARRVMPKTGVPELSRSSADDSIDDTFLSSSYQPRHHERTLSNRSSKSLAGTPPSLDKDTLAELDATLSQVKDNTLPHQTALRGPLPGSSDINTFLFLAQKYKTAALPDKPTVESYKNVSKPFEQNANYADRAGNHRAAQVWMGVGAVLQREVLTNGEQRRRARLSKAEQPEDPFLTLPDISFPVFDGEDTLFASGSAAVADTSRAAIPDGHVVESDSNMPTPLAKPHVSANSSHSSNLHHNIPEPPHDDQLSLPPSVVSGGSSGMHQAAQISTAATAQKRQRRENLEAGTSWFNTNDINERKAQIANWRAQPKALLDLDTPRKDSSPAVNIPPPMYRHNSDDSFAMFPSSSESKNEHSLAQSMNSLRDRQLSMSSIPEDLLPAEQTHERSATDSFGQSGEEASQSGSSKGDVFNGSFDSLQLSESPLGTKALNPSLFPAQILGDATDPRSVEPPKRSDIPRHDAKQRARIAAPAVRPVVNMNSKDLILDDFERPPGISLSRTYPITAGKMLQKLFMYHTALVPDAQQIVHLMMLLSPFLPNSASLAAHEYEVAGQTRLAQTRHILQEYAHYCKVEVGLETDEIHAILSGHLVHLARFDIHPLQVEAVCMAYQEQLEKCMLFTSLVMLRNLVYPHLGAFQDHLLRSSTVELVCAKCNKPVSSATRKCEKCNKGHDLCPVCWQKYSPFTMTKRARKMEDAKVPAIRICANGRLDFSASVKPPTSSSPSPSAPVPNASGNDEPKLEHPSLWQFCLTCGHGAHAACLQTQPNVPELGGRCATAGCGCACVRGMYRSELVKRMEEEKAKNAMGSVKGDGRRVRESGAVKGARGLLGEEGKRVRLVEPER